MRLPFLVMNLPTKARMEGTSRRGFPVRDGTRAPRSTSDTTGSPSPADPSAEGARALRLRLRPLPLPLRPCRRPLRPCRRPLPLPEPVPVPGGLSGGLGGTATRRPNPARSSEIPGPPAVPRLGRRPRSSSTKASSCSSSEPRESETSTCSRPPPPLGPGRPVMMARQAAADPAAAAAAADPGGGRSVDLSLSKSLNLARTHCPSQSIFSASACLSLSLSLSAVDTPD